MGEPGKETLTDYVISAGPLSTFEFLYDVRLDRIRDLKDFHTMEITEKTIPDQKFSDYGRDPLREFAFVTTFLAGIAGHHSILCGFRDVTAARADDLKHTLTGHPRVRWTSMKYGTSDDDLVLCQFTDVKTDLLLLQKHHPPSAGAVFFYLTGQSFDLYEIYWSRKAGDSTRVKEEHFRRDVIAYGHESHITLFLDEEGSFTIMTHPKFLDDAAVRKQVMAAGKRALMNITVAPSLFG